MTQPAAGSIEARIAALPRWARDYIEALTRQRDGALEQRREFLEVVTDDSPKVLCDNIHQTFRNIAEYEDVRFKFEGRYNFVYIDKRGDKVTVRSTGGALGIHPIATNCVEVTSPGRFRATA